MEPKCPMSCWMIERRKFFIQEEVGRDPSLVRVLHIDWFFRSPPTHPSTHPHSTRFSQSRGLACRDFPGWTSAVLMSYHRKRGRGIEGCCATVPVRFQPKIWRSRDFGDDDHASNSDCAYCISGSRLPVQLYFLQKKKDPCAGAGVPACRSAISCGVLTTQCAQH